MNQTLPDACGGSNSCRSTRAGLMWKPPNCFEADHFDAYLGEEHPGERSLCGH